MHLQRGLEAMMTFAATLAALTNDIRKGHSATSMVGQAQLSAAVPRKAASLQNYLYRGFASLSD
jgi:hypothetical protein